MSSKRRPVRKRKAPSGASILCRILGTLILLVVIIAAGMVTVPRFMGYDIYHVVSGSMEPTIPTGSIAYVKPIEPSDVAEDSIIAFQRGDSVVIHRAIRNYTFNGLFVTKGDANETEDIEEINYSQFIGVVVYTLPVLGQYFMLLMTGVGKILIICFAACGALLNIVAGRLET